jgi:hypothetical protein
MAMGEMLVEKRLITPGQLESALEHQREHGGKLGEILVARGLIDRLTLASALGQQWGKVTETRSVAAPVAPAGSQHEALIASQREEIAALRSKVAELERMVEWLKQLTTELTRSAAA